MRRNGELLSFSSRKTSQITLAFKVVRKFVSKVDLRLLWTKLSIGCSQIEAFRAENPGNVGLRSLMHVGHLPETICALPICGEIGHNFLIGLLLHEFGHLGSGGGEREADEWIKNNFKIPIYYRSKLDVEWVSEKDVRRIAIAVGSQFIRGL